MPHPGGRPTLYEENILIKTDEYIQQCIDNEYSFVTLSSKGATGYKESISVKLPTVEGLALHLCISRETVYQWAKEYAEFSDKVTRIKNMQAQRLIDGGLSGKYNPKIAGLLLSSAHGYRESKDITTNGKDLPTPIVDLTALAKNARDVPSVDMRNVVNGDTLDEDID